MGEYTATVSKQLLGKHVPAKTNTHATMNLLLERKCLLCGPCRYLMSRAVWSNQFNLTRQLHLLFREDLK